MGDLPGQLEFKVKAADAGLRLDHMLLRYLPEKSRSGIKKLILSGHVRVNQAEGRPSRTTLAGDLIQVTFPLPEEKKTSSGQLSELPLEILYEDDYLIVLNKAAGVLVHPGAGQKGPSLVDSLLSHCSRLSAGTDPGGQRPGIVHRLDQGTSGALVCAKNDAVHEHLAGQFRDKTNRREYTALLNGVPPFRKKFVESYLFRDPENRRKYASASAKSIQEGGLVGQRGYRLARSCFIMTANYGHRLSQVSVRLETGRTHQIRVHAASLGCPVLGDPLYGCRNELPSHFDSGLKQSIAALNRQMLHAEILGFLHPVFQKYMEFIAPFPDDFLAVRSELEAYKISDNFHELPSG